MIVKFLAGLDQAGTTKLFAPKNKNHLSGEEKSFPCSFFTGNTCHWGALSLTKPKKPD